MLGSGRSIERFGGSCRGRLCELCISLQVVGSGMLPLGTCRCDEAVVVAYCRVVDEGVGDDLGYLVDSQYRAFGDKAVAWTRW